MSGLSIVQFRRMYQNKIDMKKTQFLINLASEEDWIIISTPSLSNVHVAHKVAASAVDLSMFAPSFNIVGSKVPPNCQDRSTAKTRQFRWIVDTVDPTIPPFDQTGVKQAIEITNMAFAWVRANRMS